MPPGRRPLVAGVAAGLVTLVLLSNRDFRHPATRRLSDAAADASDACEYCERLTRERSFEPAFARAQGEEVSLTGGAGDGYCFDTNSIHAGELGGRKARYVVVMEFHSGIIEDAFSRHGLHFRSPFGLR